MADKFKVGDIVTPTSDLYDYSEFTQGKYYVVTDLDEDGDPYVTNDDGYNSNYDSYHWIKVTSAESGSQASCEFFIDKFTTFNKKKFKVEGWGCATKSFNEGMPKVVLDIVKKHGHCYFVHGGNIIAPVSKVETVNTRVVLNDEYTAVISKDEVVVGCQHIPIEKVREIMKNHSELYGN